MSDNNGWPDPARPGVPLNPERDGWHWFVRGDFYSLALWHRGHFTFQDTTAWPEEFSQLDMTYAGPCLTPAEVDARVKETRRDALEEAEQRAAHYERMAYQHGHLPVDDPHECAAQVAREIEASIRALSDTPPGMVLVPREPTDAMIKACLQAALDFMAETKTTEVHPGQTYPSPSENARRCWRAMVKAAGKGEGDD